VTDWFDPETWLRQAPDPLNLRGLAQDAATDWTNEVLRLARGRQVEVRGEGLPVRGTVSRVTAALSTSNLQGRLTGSSAPIALDRVNLGLVEVDWQGHPVDRVDIDARDITIGTHLGGGPAQVRATVPLATATRWLAKSDVDVMGPAASGTELTVRYTWRRVTVTADVAVRATGGALVFVLRRASVRGRTMKLPRRFDIAINVDVPLPKHIRLRDAAIADESVIIELEVSELSHPVRAEQVINTLSRGVGRAIFE
jgi:hypothetical protein